MPVSRIHPRYVSALVACLFLAALCAAAAPAQAAAQKQQAVVAKKSDDATGEAKADEPPFNEYKGVRLGMDAAEARKKLGNPQDKSDAQDFYSFSGDKELVQVYYEGGKVSAIAVSYMGMGASDPAVPTAKAVFGEPVEAQPDGSVRRMERYPKAGYWLSYTRTAGDAPMVVVTLKKID